MLKSVVATSRSILFQFLLEAMTIVTVDGVLGVACGYGVTATLQTLPLAAGRIARPTSQTDPLPVCGTDQIEALRHEHRRSLREPLWRQKPAPSDRRSAVAAGTSACATSYQRLASRFLESN